MRNKKIKIIRIQTAFLMRHFFDERINVFRLNKKIEEKIILIEKKLLLREKFDFFL